MLIGCDVPEVHEVLEQRMGVGKQPYAVKMIPGWILRGPSGVRDVDMKKVNFVALVEMLAKYYELEFKDMGGVFTLRTYN